MLGVLWLIAMKRSEHATSMRTGDCRLTFPQHLKFPFLLLISAALSITKGRICYRRRCTPKLTDPLIWVAIQLSGCYCTDSANANTFYKSRSMMWHLMAGRQEYYSGILRRSTMQR